jgi:hypothetical protein
MDRILAFAALAFACAPRGAEPATPTSAPAAAPSSSATGSGASAEPGMTATPPSAAAPATPATGSSTTVPPAPPPGVPTLPALSVKTMGLHVGGGPNDADTKAPFLAAIESRFPDFLRCYQLVTEPGKGGSFGVDLKIPAAGGKPEVEQPRSALAGEAFTACMVHAFESVEFPRLKKAFVVSYSLRFAVAP